MKQRRAVLALCTVFLLFLGGGGVALAQSDAPGGTGWYARYWNNLDQVGQPVWARNEGPLDHNWGLESPHALVNSDGFSARWTSFVYFEAGTYRFTLTSDDGARLWIDDRYVIDSWEVRPETTDVVTVQLDEGTHSIALDYFDVRGHALVSLDWQRVDEAGNESVTISPLQGPVGTVLDVTASGFTPNSTVLVGIGHAQSETVVDVEETTDAAGRLETTIAVPEIARVGEPWVVVVRSGEELGYSAEFTVTEAPQDDSSIPEEDNNICGDTYVVGENDWLARIARTCNVSIQAILALNPALTNPNVVYPGQVLRLPPAAGVAQPEVSITPDSGEPGTVLQVNAIGFEPDTQATVGIGVAGSEPSSAIIARTNAQGRLQTNITVPAVAQPGAIWRVLVSSQGQSALSEDFTVTGGEAVATTYYNLRLRSGPGTNFEQIGSVPVDTTVPVLGRNLRGDWLLVRYAGQEGWIAAWLSETPELDEVPVVDGV